MSREAIAAVLARSDLASGERLVALSLASSAGRENRAWPGAPAGSARAGLSRSRYQQAREQLVVRGLLAVDERTTGRGRASTVTLVFADVGPWWDGDINVELFEAVLSRGPARGPERLLLATMAAVADERGEVRDLSTDELCAAAGIADRTYRRARASLLATGQLQLVSGVGGRGNTNVWIVRDPRAARDAGIAGSRRRIAPPAGARPLVASATSPALATQAQEPASGAAEKGGQDQTLTAENSPILTGVSERKGGQDQTLFELGSLETPAQTPAANAHGGKEPQNPRTKKHPPSLPEGGSPPDSILVEDTHLSGQPGLLPSLTDNFSGVVAHRQTAPESRDWLAKLMGTKALWQSTNQTTGHGSQHSGRGSARRVREFRIGSGHLRRARTRGGSHLHNLGARPAAGDDHPGRVRRVSARADRHRITPPLRGTGAP